MSDDRQLWSVQMRRVRNGHERPSIRLEPSRSQPDLGFARPRSGRRDGAIRRILRSGYHRNAHKQFERGVPPSLIVSSREISWDQPRRRVYCRDRFGQVSSLPPPPRFGTVTMSGSRWFRAYPPEPSKTGRSVAPSARRTTRRHASGSFWCPESTEGANNKGFRRRMTAG
jgi:hypothetical protein